MSDIEKEFYKSFNIPQKFYTIVNFGDLDNNYQEVSANSLEELFNDYNSYFDEYIEKIEDFMDWRSGYEPITSDIVLGLEKLLGSFYCGTIAFRSAYWYKLPVQHIWWTEDKKEEFVGNTRIEALLSLFIEYKENIDQNEVKALFKC